MLSLEIRFLTGRYAATSFHDRRQAEWPPHPARVYSALVAALHGEPEPAPIERRALEWLSEAGPPEILASDASPRHQSEVYVPTNDVSALRSIDAPLQKLEELLAAAGAAGAGDRAAVGRVERAEANLRKQSEKTAAAGGALPARPKEVPGISPSRQPRFFPVMIPEHDVVDLRWDSAPDSDIVGALDQIALRAARLGHSSSLVSMRVATGATAPNGRRRWRPDPAGALTLRVVGPGQLARLEQAHARHQQIEPRKLPASFCRYGEATEANTRPQMASSVLAPAGWILFEVVAPPEGGRRRLLDVSLAARLCRALRGTLLAAADGRWPEALSGHRADGTPSEAPHLAVVPLPDVGHRHATGSILGVALVPPRDLDPEAHRQLLRAVALAEHTEGGSPGGEPKALRLRLGRNGTLHLRRLPGLHPTRALQANRWTAPADRWATVTPVALGRNPGNLRARDALAAARAVRRAEEQLAADCAHVGLPQPAAVWVHPRSLHEGAAAASRFQPYPETGHGPRRVCVHAELVFQEPVEGPVVLGAGRYFGLGLCAPLAPR